MTTATLSTRTLTAPKSNKTVVTHLTDAEAIALCGQIPNHQLANSLHEQSKYRGLSMNQLVWAHILAIDFEKKQNPTVQPVPQQSTQTVMPTGQFSRLIHMFTYALKYHENRGHRIKASTGPQPRIYFQLPWGDVCVKLAGVKSKYTGQLMVTENDSYGSTYYGRIDQQGHFYPSNNQNSNVLPFLQQFAANPGQVARQYGQKTGNCCFCKRHVEDEKGDRDQNGKVTNFGSSVDNGYGLVCARRFDLYHTNLTVVEKKEYFIRHPEEKG